MGTYMDTEVAIAPPAAASATYTSVNVSHANPPPVLQLSSTVEDDVLRLHTNIGVVNAIAGSSVPWEQAFNFDSRSSAPVSTSFEAARTLDRFNAFQERIAAVRETTARKQQKR